MSRRLDRRAFLALGAGGLLAAVAGFLAFPRRRALLLPGKRTVLSYETTSGERRERFFPAA